MPDSQDSLLLRLVSHVDLFSGMPRTALLKLLGRAERVTQPVNGLFFEEGEMGASFYVTAMGLALVEKRSGSRWVELAQLRPGDTFGEMSLLDEKYRSAQVRAAEPTVCLRFASSVLDDAPDIQAVIFKNMARMLSRRLKTTSTKLAELKAANAAAAAARAGGRPSSQDRSAMRGDEREHLRSTFVPMKEDPD
ncbi:MAG: Crp/Fnr family transcriptional regulator [Betaproteobacteria bacterium]